MNTKNLSLEEQEKKKLTTDPVVDQAQTMLTEQLNKSSQPTWQEQLDETMDKILNRKPFQYDINTDALYQFYNDRFQSQGKKAMMDTMGQAATMTGGYGNTYAQMAGQQAYQDHLQGMNDIIPELYQLALDRYDREGDALKDKYSFLMANPETKVPYAPYDKAYDNEGLSDSQIKFIQMSLGVEADGKWGPASKEAAGGLTAQQAWDAWNKGQIGKPVGAVGVPQNPYYTEDPKSDYDHVRQTALKYYHAGVGTSGGSADAPSINYYLQAALSSGTITKQQYMSIVQEIAELENEEE